MQSRRSLGVALIVLGVLANNYAYLHDVILDSAYGAIILGWKSVAAIVVAVALIAVGVIVAARATDTESGES